MGNKRYTEEFQAKLIYEFNQGKISVRELTQKHDMPRSTIYRWIKREKDKQADTEKKLQLLQAQLTYINTLLMRAEITEKQYTILPAFSQKNVYPAWINFYHIPLQTLELLALKFLIQVSE